VAAGLYNLGVLLWAEGDQEQARGYYEEAISIWQKKAESTGRGINYH
jgi:tetratricopeptide (TPR) repeat protein